jgi:hypothetical protein
MEPSRAVKVSKTCPKIYYLDLITNLISISWSRSNENPNKVKVMNRRKRL